jgi:alkaline phosphatase
LAYNKAIEVAKKYVDENPDTILISTSDHETGGLSVAHQLGATYPVYNWSPEELFNVIHSAEYIAQQLTEQTAFDRKVFINDIMFRKWLGINDPVPEDYNFFMQSNNSKTEIENRVGRILSDRAMVGW